MAKLNKVQNVLIKWLASGLGLGLIPKAPGTWGTFLGIPVFYFITYRQNLQSLLFVFFFSIAACLIAEMAGPIFKKTDSPHIVIDEVAGYLVTVCWLPRTWQTIVFGFLLFRLLDITKPGPIRFVEKRIPGGIGVVADDIVAGIIGNIILQIIYSQTDWLGSQLM